MEDETGGKRMRGEDAEDTDALPAASSRPRTGNAFAQPPSSGTWPASLQQSASTYASAHQSMPTTIRRGINPLRIGLDVGGSGSGSEAEVVAERRAQPTQTHGAQRAMGRPPLPPGPPPRVNAPDMASTSNFGMPGPGSDGGVAFVGRQRGIKHSVQVPADSSGPNTAWRTPQYSPFKASPGWCR
jgi:hypothetical protein